jgi:hypothetical protein
MNRNTESSKLTKEYLINIFRLISCNNIFSRKKNSPPSKKRKREQKTKAEKYEIIKFKQSILQCLELFSPTEPNRIDLASRDPNFFNISMFFRIRFDRTELCFIAFE